MQDLSKLVRVSRNGLKLSAKVVEGKLERRAQLVNGKPTWVLERSSRIVFTGGRFGDASIDASCSDDARILAHWEGYVVANGLKVVPKVGDFVMFPSGSDPTGFRTGKVTKVGPRRATVAFRYRYGRESEKSVPFSQLWF